MQFTLLSVIIKVLCNNQITMNNAKLYISFIFQLRPNTVFSVEPSEGEIPPEAEMTLTVTANLDDCVR